MGDVDLSRCFDLEFLLLLNLDPSRFLDLDRSLFLDLDLSLDLVFFTSLGLGFFFLLPDDRLRDLDLEYFLRFLFLDLLLDLIFFRIFSATGNFFFRTILLFLLDSFSFLPLNFLFLDRDLEELELELDELELEELELKLNEADLFLGFLIGFLPRDFDLLLLGLRFLSFSFFSKSRPNSSFVGSTTSAVTGGTSASTTFIFSFLSFLASSSLRTS